MNILLYVVLQIQRGREREREERERDSRTAGRRGIYICTMLSLSSSSF